MDIYLNTLAFLGPIGPLEIGIILLIALLIFGKRLPEVGKSMGRSIVEFKKGLSGVEDDIEQVVEKAKEKETPKQITPLAETVDTPSSKEKVSADS